MSSETGFLKLFPNPASESVEISFSIVEDKGYITISALSGQIVYKSNFQLVQKLKLELISLKSDIYFVKTETPDFCITQKLNVTKK